MTATPILKWVGGKTQILTEVFDKFPTTIDDYYEPFIGGASILFTLLNLVNNNKITVNGKIYASDANPYLIHLYKSIQEKPQNLINELQKLKTELEFAALRASQPHTLNRNPKTLDEALLSPESYYYWIRKEFNKTRNNLNIESAAKFLFLNKTCFRGIYREGPNGFNVPYGNYRNPSIFDEQHIMFISELVQTVTFTCCDFTDALINVKSGDFIYLDPPYIPEKETSFVGYIYAGFSETKHTRLFQLCRLYAIEKIGFLMSNADTEQITEYFSEDIFNITKITCKRSINSKNPASKSTEVLIQPL